ncbi:MAG: hypothetical protein ACRDYA_24520 [Egibacteraceae bacterium]
MRWLDQEAIPAGWFVGYCLLKTDAVTLDDLDDRLSGIAAINLVFLDGVLAALAEREGEDARDRLLDHSWTDKLTAVQRTRLTVSGTPTQAALDRVKRPVHTGDLAPHDAGLITLGCWANHYSPDEFSAILNTWIGHVENSTDLAALVDLAGLYLHREDRVVPVLESGIWRLLELRVKHLDLGTAEWDWGQLAALMVSADPARMASIVLDLLKSGQPFLSDDQECEVLRQAARASPEAVWELLVRALQARSGYHVAMITRGWLVTEFPLAVISKWIGQDEQRAILVAGLAPAGSDSPTEIARWLLTEFGSLRKVKAALAGEFYSSSWVGHYSARVRQQIEKLEGWRDEPTPVRQWAQDLVDQLRQELAEALREEEEEES